MNLSQLANDVGEVGAVCVRGGGTRWDVGGAAGDAQVVMAPTGIDSFDPAEMTVVVGAGTTLSELADALAARGQEVALDGPPGATIGGALMVGRSPLRRGRLGEVADVLLQADCVGADGQVFVAGGPTVKNVSGYDLCRLLVGSLGTLAVVGRVILRTRPMPEDSAWMSGEVPLKVVLQSVYRPATVLWDGRQTTVRVEGHGADVNNEVDLLGGLGLERVDQPVLPRERDRWSGFLPSGGVLEVGAGVVHQLERPSPPAVAAGVRVLGDRMREAFDPRRRFNPGRDPHRVAA